MLNITPLTKNAVTRNLTIQPLNLRQSKFSDDIQAKFQTLAEHSKAYGASIFNINRR